MATKLELAIARNVELENQVATLTAECIEHRAHCEKLAKERDYANVSKDSAYRNNAEKSAEIEQVHALLDALPNAVPRKGAPSEYGSQVNHSLLTRLAAWIAARSGGGA